MLFLADIVNFKFILKKFLLLSPSSLPYSYCHRQLFCNDRVIIFAGTPIFLHSISPYRVPFTQLLLLLFPIKNLHFPRTAFHSVSLLSIFKNLWHGPSVFGSTPSVFHSALLSWKIDGWQHHWPIVIELCYILFVSVFYEESIYRKIFLRILLKDRRNPFGSNFYVRRSYLVLWILPLKF